MGDFKPVKQAKTWKQRGDSRQYSATAPGKGRCVSGNVRSHRPCSTDQAVSLICSFQARGRIGCAVQATADAIGSIRSWRDELRETVGRSCS